MAYCIYFVAEVSELNDRIVRIELETENKGYAEEICEMFASNKPIARPTRWTVLEEKTFNC